MSKYPLAFAASLFIPLLFSLAGCGGAAESKTPSMPVILKGAGATAPYLAYEKWIEAYKKEDPAVEVRFQASGSGDGIAQLQSGSIDFAATDIPLTDEQIAKMPVKPLHFPTLLSAIVPVYNLLKTSGLKFTSAALAGIFAGKIKTWNAPAIAKANPGIALPAAKIVVIHRGDASGSTYAFTEYLSQTNEPWKKDIGQGAQVKFPEGESANGNATLAEMVKNTPNSIGYVESNYALDQKLEPGLVQSSAGKFVKAGLESIGAAVEGVENQKNYRVSIVNPKNAGAYPICTFTYLVVPGEIQDIAKQKAMKRFLRWAYVEGVKIAMPMEYGILPPTILEKMKDQVEAIH